VGVHQSSESTRTRDEIRMAGSSHSVRAILCKPFTASRASGGHGILRHYRLEKPTSYGTSGETGFSCAACLLYCRHSHGGNPSCCPHHFPHFLVPEGRPDNSPAVHCWEIVVVITSPVGTTEFRTPLSIVPTALTWHVVFGPSDKSLGYCRVSLRDKWRRDPKMWVMMRMLPLVSRLRGNDNAGSTADSSRGTVR